MASRASASLATGYRHASRRSPGSGAATLDLRLTDSARAAIDAMMATLDFDEGVPCLLCSREAAVNGSPAGEHWTVGAYHPERIRFFEQLRCVSGLEFFFRCDGLVFLLWQPELARLLEGKVLDYCFRRYVVR
jgi:hypothetical protein